MYKVDKNNAITMVRGDTVILDLKFYDRNRIPYEPKDGVTEKEKYTIQISRDASTLVCSEVVTKEI